MAFLHLVLPIALFSSVLVCGQLYQEKQEDRQCLKHAMNSLLGGPDHFSQKELNHIAKTKAFDFNFNEETGDWDANTLMIALREKGIFADLFSAGENLDSFDMSKPETFMPKQVQGELLGLIVNIGFFKGGNFCSKFLNSKAARHWFTIMKDAKGKWMNLDSKNWKKNGGGIKPIGAHGSDADLTAEIKDRFTKDKENMLFVCVKAEMSEAQAEAELKSIAEAQNVLRIAQEADAEKCREEEIEKQAAKEKGKKQGKKQGKKKVKGTDQVNEQAMWADYEDMLWQDYYANEDAALYEEAWYDLQRARSDFRLAQRLLRGGN